jgi:hypothetical protein
MISLRIYVFAHSGRLLLLWREAVARKNWLENTRGSVTRILCPRDIAARFLPLISLPFLKGFHRALTDI